MWASQLNVNSFLFISMTRTHANLVKSILNCIPFHKKLLGKLINNFEVLDLVKSLPIITNSFIAKTTKLNAFLEENRATFQSKLLEITNVSVPNDKGSVES